MHPRCIRYRIIWQHTVYSIDYFFYLHKDSIFQMKISFTRGLTLKSNRAIINSKKELKENTALYQHFFNISFMRY